MNDAREHCRPGRGGHPIEFYKQVAEVYLEEAELSNRTNLAIMETWDVPRPTADRWVKRARQLGLLPPAAPRCSCRCPVHCPRDEGER